MKHQPTMMTFHLGLFILSLSSACHQQVSQSSNLSDITLRGRNSHAVIYRDGDIVLLRDCTPESTVVNRSCPTSREPTRKAFLDFVRKLNANFGVTAVKYQEVGSLALVRAEIEAVEKIATEPGHSPSEIERAEEQLNYLRSTELKLVRTGRLIGFLTAGNDVTFDSSVSDDFFKVESVFSAPISHDVWFDRYNQTHWRYLGSAFNWYDAHSVTRQLDATGQPSGPYQQGCAIKLGGGWRLPTIYDVDTAVAGGFRHSIIGQGAMTFWTSEQPAESAVPSAYVYDMNIRGSQARPVYFAADVYCVKDSNVP